MLDYIKEATVRILICTGAFALVAPLYKAQTQGVQLTSDTIAQFAASGAGWGMMLSAFIVLMTLWQKKSPHPFAALFTMIGGCFALVSINPAETGLSVHLLVSASVFAFHWVLAYLACYLASSVRSNPQLK